MREELQDRTVRRLIAIGDIHGQRALLTGLIDQIQPTADDQLVFLGDYIDRGPDSRGVIESLIDLQERFPQTVFLRGNHEQTFLDALVDLGVRQGDRLEDLDEDWAWEIRNVCSSSIFIDIGGDKTLESYGAKLERVCFEQHDDKFKLIGGVPREHIEFMEQTKLHYEYENYLFAHAHYSDRGDFYTLLWGRDGRSDWLPYSPKAGEIVVVGHRVVDEVVSQDGYLYVDTGAGSGRELSAIDVVTGKVWQTKPEGE